MKKKYLLIIFLIVLYIALFIYFGLIKNNNTVYLGDKTRIQIRNNQIKVLSNNKPFFVRPAKVYYNGKFIDGYIKLQKLEDKEYSVLSYLTDDSKQIVYSDIPIAYVGNLNIKIGNSEKNNILTNSEKQRLLEIANENKIDGKIESAFRVDFDINSDKKEETLYSYTITDEFKIYTLTIITKDDDYEVVDIIKNKDYRRPNIKKSYFRKFINFNNDNNYEIVLYQSNGDDALGEYKIYNYNNGTVVNIK